MRRPGLTAALLLALLACAVGAQAAGERFGSRAALSSARLAKAGERATAKAAELDAVKAKAHAGAAVDTTPTGAFWTAVYRSYLVILFLEIGDRTFFIAALMSARHPPVTVFVGAFGALLLMTVLSTALGVAAPLLLPHSLTHWAGAALFVFFGLQMLAKAYRMPAHGEGGSEELEEVEGELKEEAAHGKRYGAWARHLSPVLVQTFVMTFLAEWGDRSQIATITMGADYEPVGICVGGSAGHATATLLAVLGGRYLASSISERAMSFAGGATFLLFGVVACFEDPSTDITQFSMPTWAQWGSSAPAARLVDALR